MKVSSIPYTRTIFLLVLILGGQLLPAQDMPYASFFEEAYQTYPSIPRGLLEAVAYTNTRVRHVQPAQSCQGLPVYYGVMGLVEDGKEYFTENLEQVARLSGYSKEDIKRDPRTNILAYASAYAKLQQNKRMANQRVETHRPILNDLSELPTDDDVVIEYARDQQFYGVLSEMQNPHTNRGIRSRRLFDFDEIFGAENYRVLSADRVTVESQQIRNRGGDNFGATHRTTCTRSNRKPDYGGALFSAANSSNYGSRNGAEIKYITMHTVQGSYASAIAWFKNRRAGVSAHYVIRASDGQITQMVCEVDRAFHVRTDNNEAIGIEHEGFISDGTAWYTNEMYASSAALVRDICDRHQIDPRKTYGGPPTDGIRTLSNTCYHIKGHQHFRGNNHIDPGPYWDWDRFYRMVNADPTPKTYTARRGNVYDSGGKSGNYGDLARETFLIQPEGATQLRLTFDAFDLEGNSTEPFDYLDIYDGTSIAGRYIGRFTGTKLPEPILSRSGAIFMEFRSDCQVNKAGWHISYTSESENPACATPTSPVASDIFPMGATLSWGAVPGANQYIVLIKRRNFSESYTAFRTQRNSLIVTGLAANALYNWQVAAICGTDTSALVGALFTTPNTVRTGQAQIYTVRANQGRFHDSGGTLGGYGDNENYLYRIIPPDGGRVELTFQSFATEAEHDFVTVYDGVNIASARVLGTFAGNTRPGKLVSSGNGLSIQFTSDNRTNADGWTSSWRSVNSSGPPPSDPTDPTNDPPTEPVTPPVSAAFKPTLDFSRTAPETKPLLETSYAGDFSLRFDDDDKSGRGLANRFYQVVQQTPAGWRANSGAGFLFDDFSQGLRSFWTSKAGNWKVEDGLLLQTNLTLSNTNLYTDLPQVKDKVYLYHWQARMTGTSDNRRHGLHIFCSAPEREDRGNSYFVWIRDQKDGAFLEIYKTVNDEFDRKARKAIDLTRGQAYDYKVIYNPKKGRIEVYVNNEFGLSWVDAYPLTAGKGVSLRSGNCEVAYDNLAVYQSRGESVKVTVGEGGSNDLRGEGRFLVRSLVVDRAINWSRVGEGRAEVGVSSLPEPEPTPSPDPDPPIDPTPDPDPTPPPSVVPRLSEQLKDSYRDDFTLKLPDEGDLYFLPSDYVGQWTANRSLGFLHEDFFGNRLDAAWRQGDGRWTSPGGTLFQTDATVSNSNLYLPLTQTDAHVYLYQVRAKMRSQGDNKRFGLHVFASEGRSANRGDSYLVWFRFNEDEPSRVEVYRSENNNLPKFRESKQISLRADQWYDLRIRYDPSTGDIEVFVDKESVLTWRDDQAPLRSGRYISFRTGNAEAEFDDLRVYHLAKNDPLTITVGPNKMLRYTNKVKLFWARWVNGQWLPVEAGETRVR